LKKNERLTLKAREKEDGQIRQAKVRFNTTIRGLPAQLVLQWQQKGLVKSKADALRQALLALAQKFSQLENELAKRRSQDDFDGGNSNNL